MSDSITSVQLDQLLQRFLAGDAVAKESLLTAAVHRLTAIASKLLRKFGGGARIGMWSVEVLQEAYPRIAKALDDVKPASAQEFLGLARLQMQRTLLDKVRQIDGREGNRPRMSPFSAGAVDSTSPAADFADQDDVEQLGVHKDTIDRYWNKAMVKLARELAPFIDGL